MDCRNISFISACRLRISRNGSQGSIGLGKRGSGACRCTFPPVESACRALGWLALLRRTANPGPQTSRRPRRSPAPASASPNQRQLACPPFLHIIATHNQKSFPPAIPARSPPEAARRSASPGGSLPTQSAGIRQSAYLPELAVCTELACCTELVVVWCAWPASRLNQLATLSHMPPIFSAEPGVCSSPDSF